MISSISATDPPEHNTIGQADEMNKVITHARMPAARQPKSETKQDHVTLSPEARAQLLKNKGYSNQEIAIIMNRDLNTITGYVQSLAI